MAKPKQKPLHSDADTVRGNRFACKPMNGPSETRALLRDADGAFLPEGQGWSREEGFLSKAELLARTAGCCRHVWNLGKRAIDDALEARKADPSAKTPSAIDLVNRLPAWKGEFPFLLEPPSQALQQVLRDLRKAYDEFFAGQKGRPRFKQRGDDVAIRFPSPDQFEYDPKAGLVDLPKFGKVGLRNARPLDGEILSCSLTISASGRIHASLPTRTKTPRTRKALPAAKASQCGIDLGVAGTTGQAILDDGTRLGPSTLQEKRMVKKARFIKAWQRKLSKCQKGSKNRAKTKRQIARACERIANIRQDSTHQATAWAARRFALVGLEDASSKALAEKSSDEHKPDLARRLLASLWHPFKTQMAYKAREAGHVARLIPAPYTSCTCVEEHCDNFLKSNTGWRTGRFFSCPACGCSEDSETHAARTMLLLAQRPEVSLGADRPRGQGGKAAKPPPEREPRPGGTRVPEGTPNPFVRRQPLVKSASGG